MKIVAFIGAGLLAAGTIAAVPADAQRHGYGRHHGYGHGGGYRGYHGGYGHRGGYGFRGGYRPGPRWHSGYRHRGYGWNRGPRWRGGYGRVVCRVGYYGRRCLRPY